MAERVDSKNIVKHLANGTLDELCLVCLNPLIDNNFESIFTLICKEETEYCVADALEALCQFQFEDSENNRVCLDCFKSATEAYKFHLQAKQSMEIITHYTEELLNILQSVKITNDDKEKVLCIPVSKVQPRTTLFDLNIDGIGQDYCEDDNYHGEDHNDDDELNNIIGKDEIEMVLVEEELELKCNSDLNEIDMEKNIKTSYSEADEMSNLNSETDDDEELVMIINEKKDRKKRDPMEYIPCNRCPIKYRFISKLKDHMKTKHDVDIFYCKICKIVSENKEQYEEHLKTHRGKYQCTICSAVYKKEETLIVHMKSHEATKHVSQSENANICEICGAILADELHLQDHMASKHATKFTCYYCGRMYKGEASLDAHIRKHENCWDRKKGTKNKPSTKPDNEEGKNKRAICQTCGKDFVDERALLWHQRLHNNDRPYICKVCGRAFVSANRRNQHALCSHTPPSRRCPLCPALFHLRSMVNTHIKKVHLAAHKRRGRRSRMMNVFWRTQPVPIADLNVDIQDDILEMRTSLATEMEDDQQQ